ncbi:MAG: Trk family potassium uptake protein [Nitrospiraceae bacterium]|nr:MAG: Trk family potassium uptake protein [Nitrospiraceae bacterium]
MARQFSSSQVSAPKILAAGFITVILIGAGLLMIPAATHSGISPVDALFTSTSAVCVTGLIVKNTPVDFTQFGKTVILVLIQIGGLGYMSMATFIALLAGKKIGISERILLKESLNIASYQGIVRFIKGMLFFVLTAESAGAIFLYLRFHYGYHLEVPFYQAIFHSVSAFNNAGFSLFEGRLISFSSDSTVNLVIMSLIFLGGIGFTVVYDLCGRFTGKERSLMLHTRLVLMTSGLLIIVGAVLFYLGERHYLLSRSPLTGGETALVTLFSSVTARTAGFNTVDYSLLQHSTLFLTMVLMFIGASPGSTGGGIKTSTFSVVVLHVWSVIRGKSDTVAFNRTIPVDLVSKALAVMSLSVMFVSAMTFAVVHIEHSQFLKTLFEVVSAFATVGLSTGDGGVLSYCATFSDLSKSIIILTMFAGRLGPLTLFMSLIEQEQQRVRYAEGRVMIG